MDREEMREKTMSTKLVVLGIPWDVDSRGLEEYMSKFGKIVDCIVMKERSTGRSRGFGYVTFASADDATGALDSEHVMGNRTLEVKIATPKEEMRNTSNKKATRIFVARIPQSVDESMFRSHFETYGEITDLYMPKEPGAKGHRGIGFITYQSSDSVDKLMDESHELGGSTVVVDRATPKEDDMRYPSRAFQGGGYGAYSAYISAATRYAALGAPTLYDHPGSPFGRVGSFIGAAPRGLGKKLFIGRLPLEANADDLRNYFSRFGRVIDAYIPKDPKKSGHRGFGFVTFADDGAADRVARRTHEILGQEVLIDTAAPLEAGGSGRERDRSRDRDRDRSRDRDRDRDRDREREGGILGGMVGGFIDPISAEAFGGYGPMRSYGRLYGSMDYGSYGYGHSGGSGSGGGGGGSSSGGGSGSRASRMDYRYRPY